MITLLTDFGTKDYFVPAVKGTIVSIHPHANIIDLTHDIPAQDIASGAFTLGTCYQNFPVGTIHLAVVDPGVGSERRAIVIEAGNYYFVGPDNGIFSFVYAHEKNCRVFHASQAAYFRPCISPTFHGRDVFAPLAAWLAKGVAPDDLGAEIKDYVRLSWAQPQMANDLLVGEIIHIDHFGNCITNLTTNELCTQQITTTTRFKIGAHEVRHFGTHFAQAASELFAYVGSAGYWEIALWQASAAKFLAAERSTVVSLLI